jgi:hypothetical protein
MYIFSGYGEAEIAVKDDLKSSQITNEVELDHRLDTLSLDLSTVVRRTINYVVNFVGKETKSNVDWAQIGKDIQTKKLTDTAQARLSHRHKLFAEKVSPKPANLAIALVPLVIFWVLKSLLGGKLQERKFEKVLTKKRKKRRESQNLAKKRKRESKMGIPR